jgi:hypothetical protein
LKKDEGCDVVHRLTLCLNAFIGSGLSLAIPAAADAAPASLFGKSIVVTWAESRMQRVAADQQFKASNFSINLSVYASSAGRVFSRLDNLQGGATEQVEGSRANVQIPARVPRFSERSMIMFAPFHAGGTRRISVSFSPDLGSCTAKVIFAKEVGHPTAFAWNSRRNHSVEIQSMSASGESCRIQAGNVFGNN